MRSTHVRLLITLFLLLSLSGFTVSAQQPNDEFFRHIMDSLDLEFDTPDELANRLDSVGLVYRQQSSLDTAMSYFMLSFRIRERINSDHLNQSYLKLGTIAGMRKEFLLSLELFRKAMELSIGKDSADLGKAYNNISYSYRNMEEIDSSLKYQRLAIGLKEGDPDIDPSSLTRSYLNMGTAYETNKDYDSALVYFEIVLSRADSVNDKVNYAHALGNVAYMNYLLDNRDSAEKYFRMALNVAEKDSLMEVLAPLYRNLTIYHIDDTARYFFNRYRDIETKVFNAKSNQEILNLRAKYDLEKKEAELARNQLELEKQHANNRLYLIVGSSLILILSGLLAFLMYRQKLMEQLRKKDDDIHNQQVNDIIRNQELSILSARVEGQDMERQRIAEDLHDRLGSKLAAVKLYYDAALGDTPDESLVKANKLLNETIDETRRIAHNLSSGVLTRFGLVAAIEHLKETLENSRQIEIEFITHNFERHSLSKDLEINFYRIIQELISNILKHARATHVTIQLTRHEDGTVTLIVEDNGRGFNPQNVSLASMGLENLKSRVDRYEGALSIDSEPGHGTTVIVEIHEKQNQLV